MGILFLTLTEDPTITWFDRRGSHRKLDARPVVCPVSHRL